MSREEDYDSEATTVISVLESPGELETRHRENPNPVFWGAKRRGLAGSIPHKRQRDDDDNDCDVKQPKKRKTRSRYHRDGPENTTSVARRKVGRHELAQLGPIITEATAVSQEFNHIRRSARLLSKCEETLQSGAASTKSRQYGKPRSTPAARAGQMQPIRRQPMRRHSSWKQSSWKQSSQKWSSQKRSSQKRSSQKQPSQKQSLAGNN